MNRATRRLGPELEQETALLVDPAPDTVVFPLDRARPGTRETDIPRFADLRWHLAALDHTESVQALGINWERFPAPLRAAFMRAGWAVINIPTPAVLLARQGSSTRPRLAPASLRRTFHAWKFFADWLSRHQISHLDQVGRHLLAEYPQALTERGLVRAAVTLEMFALTRLWAYAPVLPARDRIPTPPWDEAGAGTGDFLGEANSGPAENTTIPVHPAAMSPLLVWALRTVTEFAPDILAAWRETRRLADRVPDRARAAGREDLRAYLRDLRETGRALPVYASAKTRTADHPHQVTPTQRRGTTRDRPLVHNAVIAGVLGVSVAQVATLLRDRPQELDGLRFGTGAPLPVPITAQLDGRPWTPAIDYQDATDLAVHLSTAALVTVAYLSGMRPKEVLNLKRGCCTTDERQDGTTRHLITGRHFKNVTDEQGNTVPGGEVRAQPWVVIELVHRAITVLEELSQARLLFPREFSKTPKPRTYLGEAMTTAVATGRISRFTAWANKLAAEHGRAQEMIPDDPDGAITMRRFRRTVAWFINRQPGGRIALGIHYGHLRATQSESYAGRSTVDMLQILDLEQALATADALTDAAERLQGGQGVSGPAAARYITAAAEFQASYAGGFVSNRQHNALLDNPRLQVFDHPQALLTCNHDPLKALCDPDRGKPGRQAQRTPSHDRCDTACANISRTDTHTQRIQAEIDRIDAETTDGLVPLPIQQRLAQRRTALAQIIARHETTRIHPHIAGEGHQ